jgi:hypothetical protein
MMPPCAQHHQQLGDLELHAAEDRYLALQRRRW